MSVNRSTLRPLVLTAGLALPALLSTPGCTTAPEAGRPASVRAEVVQPLRLDGSAYEAAARLELPPVPPATSHGLENVFELSDSIISGTEPADAAALEEIASWGVRTIISVDGKVPDHETAATLGMRYVHIPVEYAGLSEEKILKIAKTFRELEAPFYVHCYHGKHRGPAAAALGRVVLDGIPRTRAIAEMRQWCATASKYEGLYSTVASADLPTPAETAAFEFDFSPAHRFDGMRGAMVQMARKWDLIKAARKRSWQADPEHPDVVPLQEATQLQQLIEQCAELDEMRAWPDDFRSWMAESRSQSELLVQALTRLDSGAGSAGSAGSALRAGWVREADEAQRALAESCLDCHSSYRNR